MFNQQSEIINQQFGPMSDSPKLVIGAAPEGAHDPDTAARAVRDMFTSIAPRYDLLNHILSFNIDRLWWLRTAGTFSHILAQLDCRVLDLCCYTTRDLAEQCVTSVARRLPATAPIPSVLVGAGIGGLTSTAGTRV